MSGSRRAASPPRAASRSACSGASPASIAKQMRRRGNAGRAQVRTASQAACIWVTYDVSAGHQEGSPAAVGEGGAHGAGPGCTSSGAERSSSSWRRGAQSSMPPGPERAAAGRQRPDEPLVEGGAEGPRIGRRDAGRGPGAQPGGQVGDAGMVGRDQAGGLVRGQRLDAERARQGDDRLVEAVGAHEGRAPHGVVVGRVDRPLRLAVDAQHPVPARPSDEGRAGAAVERRQEGLGPEVLVHIDGDRHRRPPVRIARAGTPATRPPAGTSSSTTAPAATTARSPMVRPWRITAPVPTCAPSPDRHRPGHPGAGGDVGGLAHDHVVADDGAGVDQGVAHEPGVGSDDRAGQHLDAVGEPRRPGHGRRAVHDRGQAQARVAQDRGAGPPGGRVAGRRRGRRTRGRRRRPRRAAMASPPTTGQPSTVLPSREGSASSRATTRKRKTDSMASIALLACPPEPTPTIGVSAPGAGRGTGGQGVTARGGAARAGVVRSFTPPSDRAEAVGPHGAGRAGHRWPAAPVHQFYLSIG